MPTDFECIIPKQLNGNEVEMFFIYLIQLWFYFQGCTKAMVMARQSVKANSFLLAISTDTESYSFQTDRSGPTRQTQIRLLLEEQSDQTSLFAVPYAFLKALLHYLTNLRYVKSGMYFHYV